MYGQESWFLIYQADVRFRSEEMERICRNVQITYESQTPEENARTGYVSERPWDWVWRSLGRHRSRVLGVRGPPSGGVLLGPDQV